MNFDLIYYQLTTFD